MEYMRIKDTVTRRLRDDILAGKLDPGYQLDLKMLAKKFGCSMTPIREALNILDGEGLIETKRHKCAVVSKIDGDELHRIFEIRALLEGYSSKIAASKINKSVLEKLESNLREQGNSNEKQNYLKWLELNRKFHNEIFECADNPVLSELITLLRNRTFHYVRAYTVLMDRSKIATLEHQEIFNAIKAKDGTAAEELTKKHLTNLSNSLKDFLNAKRELKK